MTPFRRALLRWLGHEEPSGLKALFTPDPLLDVTPLDPSEVGRTGTRGEQILAVAAWLDANGWSRVGRGDRQIYAVWLLELRDAYERQGART